MVTAVTVTVWAGLNPGSSSWTSQVAEPSRLNNLLTLVFLESAPRKAIQYFSGFGVLLVSKTSQRHSCDNILAHIVTAVTFL